MSKPLFKQTIDPAAVGVNVVGESPYGMVNVLISGAASATLGYINTTGAFVQFANGAVTGESSTVVTCGHGCVLAVDVVGAGASITTNGI